MAIMNEDSPWEGDDPAGLQQRTRETWQSAYDRHVGAIFGFVASLLRGSRQPVEEVHQQVWLAAIESIDRFDPAKGDFRSWVLGIARRHVALHFRKQLQSASGMIGPDEDRADQ